MRGQWARRLGIGLTGSMALLLCWLMVGLKLQVGPFAFTSQWHETVYWNHPPETMTEDLLVDSGSSPEVAAR